MPEPKLYAFSTHIGTACNKYSRNFADLAEKLKMDVVDLMRQQCQGPNSSTYFWSLVDAGHSNLPGQGEAYDRNDFLISKRLATLS